MTLVSRSDNTMIAFYSSLEEATQDEISFALTNGYCLSTRRINYVGNNTAGLIKSRIIFCVHGDERGTRWSSKIINAEHNHEAVDNVAAYPHSRNLTSTEVETVHSLSVIGATPRVVLGALRQLNYENISNPQDIYNAKASKKRNLLDGRLSIEALLDSLIMQGVQHAFSRDHQGNLNSLYISPKSAEICVRHYSASKVFLLDSTYKTNKYHMPLLHGTGVSATDETFTFFIVSCALKPLHAISGQ
ncbi:hypothetical protein K3495_g12435 [Podosphaera aphanis]|nr:hypothetical protein K3495_g12435 [Podosphaera aphanis]